VNGGADGTVIRVAARAEEVLDEMGAGRGREDEDDRGKQ
jgi:hypothetical protein